MSEQILKISSKSNPNSIAGAIVGQIKETEKSEMRVIGAGALNQAMKAIVIARGYLAPVGINIVCIPAFVTIQFNREEMTGLKILVKVDR